jgi:hypothetical protein
LLLLRYDKFGSESIWSWALLCWETITLQFHCLLEICLASLYSPGSILAGNMHLEIYPFLLDFPTCYSIIISNGPLDFSGDGCNILFLISNSINFGLLSFFSLVWLRFCLFKEPNLCFIDLYHVLHSISWISAVIFIISCLCLFLFL